MVFSSYEFIFIFLPLAFAAFAIAQRAFGWEAAFAVTGLASLIYYGQWSLKLLAILLISVVTNYVVGNMLIRMTKAGRPSGWLLAVAVAANLLSLGYFKYMNFFIDVANQTTGAGFSHIDIILPVGISFYTFIQIGFLIEAHGGQAEQQPFTRYLTFATFFPTVTAGPLVLQREFFDQMSGRKDSALDPRRISVGLTLFAMGLFKKVILADSIGVYANDAFDGVAAGQSISTYSAWVGSLAYSLQLYFDFSGYSDMAIGLGAIFGLKLPLNFNSPFKATSISDFWQRWHMTMTRFFTRYVYSPMAFSGMRRAVSGGYNPVAKYMVAGAWPIIFTMLIAGIWHGSGWTFALFGLLHGIAIAINNGWKQFELPKLPAPVGWLLTMAVVVSGLVVFRAADVPTALTILSSMWGVTTFLGSPDTAAVVFDTRVAAMLVVALGAVALLAPNTQEIIREHWTSSDPKPSVFSRFASYITWKPALAWSVASAFVLVVALANIGSTSSFLYYKF